MIGVNRYLDSEPSPLLAGNDTIQLVPEHVEQDQIKRLQDWRAARDRAAVASALEGLRKAALSGSSMMEPSILAAKAGVTTGEWGEVLRQSFGEYRAPTGVSASARQVSDNLDEIRSEVERVSLLLGRRLTFVIGKPGLDGHSNGAEQIAVRARDSGMDVVYDGIRLTPQDILSAAQDKQAHCIGLSILSGSHIPLVRETLQLMKAAGMDHIPLIVGGIIPPEDERKLLEEGVRAIYTPKNFNLNRIMLDIVSIVEHTHSTAP